MSIRKLFKSLTASSESIDRAEKPDSKIKRSKSLNSTYIIRNRFKSVKLEHKLNHEGMNFTFILIFKVIFQFFRFRFLAL